MTTTGSQQDYLKKLLGKHEGKGKKAENYLRTAEEGYETKIKMGKYEIREGAEIPHRKAQSMSKAQAENLKTHRKSLQKNLELVDSRIGEMTDPDTQAKKIDEKERKKFVSQMAKARRELDKKREDKLQEEMKKLKQIQDKQEEEKQKKRSEERERRKSELLKRSQSLQVTRKNRKQEFQNQNKFLKAKMQEKTLSDRMMEKFRLSEAQGLQYKKRKLAEIRSLHQPLSKSEFQTHLQKIEKLKSERSRVFENSSRYMAGDTTKFYKSSWYKKVTEVPVKFEAEAQQEELDHVKQVKDKLKKYGEYVRQNFKPEVSKKKAKDLASKNVSSPIPNIKYEELRELGNKYLKYSKQLIDPNKKQNVEDSEEDPKVFKHKNYLEDIKKNRKGEKSSQNFAESIKKNTKMSSTEKAHKILDYVTGLERKAKLKEQKGKIHPVLLDEELDDLYMEAIALKLSMLGKDEEAESQKID